MDAVPEREKIILQNIQIRDTLSSTYNRMINLSRQKLES